jgi:hypothetical protein
MLNVITGSYSGSNLQVYVQYNGTGQVSSLQIVSVLGTTQKTFTYGDSTIFVTTTVAGAKETDSVRVNADGFMLSDYNRNGSDSSVTTYSYDATGSLLYSYSITNYSGPVQTNANYTNGDLTSMVSGSDTTTYAYNDDKLYMTGDYFQVVQLLNNPAPTIKNTHQLAAYTQGGIACTISYTYDNTGKISSMTLTKGTNAQTLGYQYSCN